MKPDEKYFAVVMLHNHQLPDGSRRRVRALINVPEFPMHHKRAWAILEKWSRRNWYDYGVTLDLGWLTPEGVAARLGIK